MASRIYLLALVGITGLLGVVWQPNLPLAIAQTQITPDRKVEADRLLKQGNEQFSISQFESAMQSWLQALQIFREIGDRQGEAQSLGSLGLASDALGNFDKAIAYQMQSLAIAQETKNRRQEATSLRNLGKIYESLGKFDLSVDYGQKSLAIAQEIGDRRGEGQSLINLGVAYRALGNYGKAIECHEKSLAITREISDRRGEGSSLGNLGMNYYAQGDYLKAIEYHEQRLAIALEIKDRQGEGNAMGNLGNAYRSLGNYAKAIEYHQKRLAITREIREIRGEGQSLGFLGLVYRALGDYPKSIAYYKQSLAIAIKIKDQLGKAKSLGYLGRVYYDLGDYNEAIKYHQSSLEVAREIRDRRGEGKSLGYLGRAYEAKGNYDKAIEFYQSSLKIAREIGDRLGEGEILGFLGGISYEFGDYAKAIEYHKSALEIARKTKNRDAERTALSNIGLTLQKQNQLNLSIVFYKQSIDAIESIRKDIRNLDKEVQKSYLNTVESSYRTLADLLLQQGRVTEAMQVLDLLKIQELEDYLKNVKGNDRTVKGIELLEPEKAFSSQISAVSYEKIPELNSQLKNQIQQLPKSEINKVPDYLQKLPQGVVLIYPLILSDRLEIVVFSAKTLPINRTIPIKRAELVKAIEEYRSDLQDHSSIDVKNSSKKLYDLLIKPIESDLKQAKATTILYAPDGLLRYIPLAALYDGKQWLVEKYRINNLIAYSLFEPDSKPKANLRIFAGAYGGKGGETRFGLSGLPATIPEVDRISATFSDTTKLVEQEFTAQASKAKVVGQTIVHFATHAQFKSGSPLDSYVLFGDGSKVTLSEINEWNLKDADLVVLSACQTGVGSLGNGAEILGFGYQVQRAGAKASIASLWTVSDGGTQLLMEAFYGNLQKGNTSMSTSLREAQLNMIRRSVKQGEINYNHPYYWSAFVLIGNGL